MRGEGNIKIPRSRCAREMLAKNGLIGKVTLTSDMDEDKIRSDIFSIFQKAMRKNSSISVYHFATSRWHQQVADDPFTFDLLQMDGLCGSRKKC